MRRIRDIGATAAFAAALAPAWAEQPPSRAEWRLSVGRLVVTHQPASDFWSDPDYYVQATRWDPSLTDRRHRILVERFDLRAEEREVMSEREPLVAKKQASEIVPGPPLTPEEEERFATLLAEADETDLSCPGGDRREGSCTRCSASDDSLPCRRCRICEALSDLRRRKAASEVVPGEPLTEDEAARLLVLTARLAELEDAISRATTELDEIASSVTGRTHVVTTGALTIHFGPTGILGVYAGDILEIAVLESDVAEDDLHGRTVFRLEQGMLDAGFVDLVMPNVRSLQLHLQPVPGRSPPPDFARRFPD